WTPMPSMTAIAMAPAFADSADTPSTRRAWCHALRALTEARRHVPLNGIAVCFAARDLQHVPGLREAAGRLRRRIDEAALHLRLQFPVFLLVTGLEGLPGYAVVRDALPDAVVREAVGHRLPLDAHRGTGETGEVFATPMAQWQALRMTLLRAHPAASERLAIHTFVEGLRDMEAGLAIVTDVLFAPDENGAPVQPWRGLYLTAADARGGVFVHDLFERFLPADRPLAHAITSPRRSGSGARRSSR
ncbi:MAG: type VI secretion system protein, partial [Luteibacter sp.]